MAPFSIILVGEFCVTIYSFYHDAKVGFILKFHCTLDSIFTASLIPILLYY